MGGKVLLKWILMLWEQVTYDSIYCAPDRLAGQMTA